jgi:hypothetical protein
MQNSDIDLCNEDAIALVDEHRLCKLRELATSYNEIHPESLIDSKYLDNVDDIIFSLWARGERVGPLGYGRAIDKLIQTRIMTTSIDNEYDYVYELNDLDTYIFFKHPKETRRFVITEFFRSVTGGFEKDTGEIFERKCDNIKRFVYKICSVLDKYVDGLLDSTSEAPLILNFALALRKWSLSPIEWAAILMDMVFNLDDIRTDSLRFLINGTFTERQEEFYKCIKEGTSNAGDYFYPLMPKNNKNEYVLGENPKTE